MTRPGSRRGGSRIGTRRAAGLLTALIPFDTTGGVHKKEYWKHTLEDVLDVWAKLPEIAALVYANTYKGGKARDGGLLRCMHG